MAEARMRESVLVKQLLDYLKTVGIPAWRQNQGAMVASYGGRSRFIRFSSAKGASDILGIIPPDGRMLAVEAKMPGNKPSPDQVAFLANIKASGGLAVLAYSLDDLIAGLEGK